MLTTIILVIAVAVLGFCLGFFSAAAYFGEEEEEEDG